MNPMLLSSLTHRRIKWSYATRNIPALPADEQDLARRLVELDRAPACGDVAVAEVTEIGLHKRIELRDGRRATLFPGDLVGVVYGFQNASRYSEGAAPGTAVCHLLSSGGLCGELQGSLTTLGTRMSPPTRLVPRGVLGPRAQGTSLREFGLSAQEPSDPKPRTIVVVGSGPESGKTTAACSLVNGLVRAGYRVCFGKPCGTASQRDLGLMQDAGALATLDFTDAGHPSTARCTQEEIEAIVDAIHAHLSAPRPDFILLEVADGIGQRESSLVLERLFARRLVDHTIYTAHDTLGVREGLDRLRALGAEAVTISGRVTCSPLALREAQAESDAPVLRAEELRERAFVDHIALEAADTIANGSAT